MDLCAAMEFGLGCAAVLGGWVQRCVLKSIRSTSKRIDFSSPGETFVWCLKSSITSWIEHPTLILFICLIYHRKRRDGGHTLSQIHVICMRSQRSLFIGPRRSYSSQPPFPTASSLTYERLPTFMSLKHVRNLQDLRSP